MKRDPKSSLPSGDPAKPPTGLAAALAAGAVAFTTVGAQAATITANSLADNTTGGNAQCTVREALANANSNSDTTGGDCVAGSGADTINLTGLAGTLTLGGTQLSISDSTTITGPGAATLSIDAANNSRVFYIYNNASALTVTISGLTVTRGRAANGANIISKGEIVALNNVTLSGGVATSGGGGITNSGGSLTLQSSTISGNTAQGSPGGGGVYNVGGALTITDSFITGNNASTVISKGGGISILSTTQPTTITNTQITTNSTSGKGGAFAVKTTAAGGTLTIDRSVISGNTSSGRGGAFFLYRNTGAIDITKSEIRNNITSNRGGGIFLYNAFGNVTISDTTLSGNTANSASGNGGAIFFYRSAAGVTVRLERSTISGNATSRSGGAIFFYKGSGKLAIDDSTISGNTAGISGGAIFDRGPFGGTATLDITNSTLSGNTAATSGGNLNVTAVPTTIRNSIIANGSAPSGPDALTGGANVTMDFSLLENTSGATFGGANNITGVDPSLGSLQDNGGPTFTHRPGTGSAALDAGDPGFISPPATDQRGLARVYNGRIDMGSLEQGAMSSFTFTSAGTTVGEAAGSATLAATRSSGEGTASVNYSTADGTAIAGADYTATSGTLTWAAGDFAAKPISVPILEDTIDETNEFLNVVLNSPSNGTLGTPSSATVTITDNDSAPSIGISGVSQAEGNSGSTAFTFVVTLSNPSSQTVTVNYTTTNGTAIAGSDFTATSGTLTFAAGVTSQNIVVSVTGDTTNEGNEAFTVNLSAPTNATIGTATATGTINNDDAAPTISIGDVSSNEGNSGTTNFTFPVTLSAASAQTITVNYTTVNGTAVAGSDFTTATGTLTFAPGITTQNAVVSVTGDTTNEANETFSVTLNSPTNASIADGTGAGTIVNDDAVPTLSIGDVSQAEGNSGTTNFSFPVTLSAASEQTVTVNYTTSDGTALAGSDYAAASGTVTFAPGATSQSITVLVNGDTTSEPNETFNVTLATPTNATLADSTATGTITNDDTSPALSIGSVTQAEGNSGTTTFSFPVTLSAPSGQTVTVNYATSNGSANAGSDYGATSGTLTFAPGVTSQSISVPVTGDVTSEPDETFTVTLSAPSNATITAPTATGTIVNDDTAPSISIAGSALTEGDSGSTNMPFNVTLSTASEQTVTVNYTTVNGSAVAGSDFTASSGVVTFAPGVTSQTINIPILGDTVFETDEAFTVALSAPSNATIATGTATGSIVNDDGVVTVSVGDVTQAEGNSGTTNFSFPVTLSAASGQTITVNYATSNGTANSGSDYAAASGTVTFAPGVTSQTITILVNGDTTSEPNETFLVTLATPTNATLADSTATGTITDDDTAPTLSIGNVTEAEGNSGTTTFSFPVTLSAPSGQTVTVNYATSNGTANAGSDYGATSGTLTFAPGVTSQTISVPVTGDVTSEGDETFTVTLSTPSNATLATASGTGTIVNDDTAPSISIAGSSLTEGDSGTTNMPFNVTLSTASEQTVTVNYTTVDGSAVAGSDFTASSGVVTFAPGVTSQTINVPILGDTVSETDEAFTIALSAPSNATLSGGTATGTIVNDDGVVTVSVGDVTQAEGTGGTTSFSFPVTLSAASEQTITVNYATSNGTANSGSDYTAASGTVTFAPGVTSQTITVLVNGDTTSEPSETFLVTLETPTNATLADSTATGTITDDDTAPALSIGSVSQAEGNSGTTTFSFPVTLSAPSGQTVTVNFTTNNGTAIAGSDYGATSGTVTFAPGVTSQTISIPVTGDVTSEADETFTVALSTPSNATIASATGTGTIVNDDTAPAISIGNASLTEGNSGSANMTFNVTLSTPSEQPITVNYSTVNGTAIGGSDFTATSGVLTFAPGTTTQTIDVPILGDTISENNETLTLALNTPSNATIANSNGTGTIVNDDAVVSVSIGDVSQAEGNSGTSNFAFTVSLSTASEQTVTVNYATIDGTAVAATDYTATSGTVTFAPGITTQTVNVPVSGDLTKEATETFSVALSSPVNATLGTATGNGTIVDDDNAPVLAIDNVSRAEGDTASTNFAFTVTLSQPSGETVTVDYATANGTAIAGEDYGATSGTLTFAPGVTSQTINVPVLGDAVSEPDETFTVVLSSATNAPIGTTTGTGTIINDDTAPSLTINDAAQPEGDSGAANMTFTVTLSAPSEETITVNYSTANGSALAGSDYSTTSGTLTFAPGVTSQTIDVSILGDVASEPDETFNVVLSAPTNAAIADTTATGTILSDDAAYVPQISINDTTTLEGDSGTTPVTFTLTLDAATTQAVTVDYHTTNINAAQGQDYVGVTGSVIFPPGTTSRTVTVGVIGDTVVEPNETFALDLTSPVGATIADARGVATIFNDDNTLPEPPQPRVSITGARVTEGDSGIVDAALTVQLSNAAATEVSVNFTTADGTAHSGSDYALTSGTLVFPAGTTSRIIHVPVLGDTIVEGDETFVVRLSSPNGVRINTGEATVTIVDDDIAIDTPRGYIAIAGATPGAGGSFFRTSLQLHNTSDAPAAGQVVFHRTTGGTPAIVPYSLAPHQTLDLDDAALANGIGSIDLVSITGPAPIAVIRINSTSDCGTVGMSTQSLDATRDALTAPAHAVLIAPADLGTSRFNVGIRAIANPATLRLTLHDAAGNTKTQIERTFAADTLVHVAAADLLGTAVAANDSIELEVLSGTVIAYGATTDNTSQDPALQLARPLP